MLLGLLGVSNILQLCVSLFSHYFRSVLLNTAGMQRLTETLSLLGNFNCLCGQVDWSNCRCTMLHCRRYTKYKLDQGWKMRQCGSMQKKCATLEGECNQFQLKGQDRNNKSVDTAENNMVLPKEG